MPTPKSLTARARMYPQRSIHDQRYNAETLARQALWRVCCSSCDEHRFDCLDAGGAVRGKGPVWRPRP